MHPQFRWLVPPAIVLSAGVAHAEQYMSIAEAQAVMFPGQQLSPANVTLTPDQVRAIEKSSGVRVRVRDVRAWRAANGGVLFLDQVIGKHEYITWALAVNGDGSVRDVQILDYRETYGAEIRNANWRAQFVGKTHGAELKLTRDIKNISGATLSCRHVTDGVKRLLATYEIAFKR